MISFSRACAQATISVALGSPLPAFGQWLRVCPARLLEAPVATLVVNPPSVDLGMISDDQSVRQTVTLANRSVREVTFRGVRSTCGCTTAGIIPRSLKPGERADLEIAFHPQGKLDEQREEVTIATDGLGDIVVEVRAIVDPEVRVSPKAIYWEEVARESGGAAEIVVTGPLDSFAVSNVVWDGTPGVRATINGEGEQQVRGRLRRTIRIGVQAGEVRPGPFKGTVLIRTNHPLKQLLSVSVGGWVLGRIRADTASLRFGEPVAGRPVSIEVAIIHADGVAFEAKAVRDLLRPGVVLDWRAQPAGSSEAGARLVRVTVPTSIRAESVRGQLMIETTCPGEPPVRVPYQIALRRP